MKKITSLSIALLLAVLVMPSFLKAAAPSDVGQHKNRTAISYLMENGIVEGYEDGTYRPDAKINRAEFTKIIIEATYDEETIENCLPQQMQSHWTYTFFPDVDRNAWYAKYVCVAKMNNIVSGYEDNLFRPTNEINKAESIKILINAKGYQVPEAVTDNTYSDVMPDAWFAPYVKAAFDANLIEDTGSATLNPGNPMTRAGMSEMTYRALVAKGNVYQMQELAEEMVQEEEVLEAEEVAEEETAETPEELLETDEDVLNDEVPNTATIDCGDDLDCMILASAACEPSLMDISESDKFVMPEGSTMIYNVIGASDEKCELEILTNETTMSCLFEGNSLTDFFTDWKNGLDTSDYLLEAGCSAME